MADEQKPKQQTPAMPKADTKGTHRDAAFLTGLIGRGIQASRSPMMHQQEADAQGLRLIYRLLDLDVTRTDDLSQLVNAAELMGFSGLNITYPCKQAVIPLLNELSEEAMQVGAVNTVLFRDGRKIGYNTDLLGFSEGFTRGLGDVKRDVVAQIGTGGAGAATATAILRKGCKELRLVDSDPERAKGLAIRLMGFFPDAKILISKTAADALAGADGMINATPVGMAKYPGTPVEPDLLRADMWVSEIVYFPLETELLRLARAKGCRTVDGSGMAVFQAAAAFDLFTGHIADRERMLERFNPVD
jgi:shikimate dehydrogenase